MDMDDFKARFERAGMFFDKEGKPITREEWGRLKFGNELSEDYARIGLTYFEDTSDPNENACGEEGDRLHVSTVWLGMDLGFRPDAPPVVFETMVFGGTWDGHCERYCTEAQAREGHERWVERVSAEVQLLKTKLDVDVNLEGND